MKTEVINAIKKLQVEVANLKVEWFEERGNEFLKNKYLQAKAKLEGMQEVVGLLVEI